MPPPVVVGRTVVAVVVVVVVVLGGALVVGRGVAFAGRGVDAAVGVVAPPPLVALGSGVPQYNVDLSHVPSRQYKNVYEPDIFW